MNSRQNSSAGLIADVVHSPLNQHWASWLERSGHIWGKFMNNRRCFWPLHSIAAFALFFLGFVIDAGAAELQLATAARSEIWQLLRGCLPMRLTPNATDDQGINALGWAARSGHVEVARLLINAHAAVDGAFNFAAYTPLFRTAFWAPRYRGASDLPKATAIGRRWRERQEAFQGRLRLAQTSANW